MHLLALHTDMLLYTGYTWPTFCDFLAHSQAFRLRANCQAGCRAVMVRYFSFITMLKTGAWLVVFT